MTKLEEPPVHVATAHGPDDALAPVLIDHLIMHGSASRTELSTVTGLGRTAVAGLTTRLKDAGILVDAASAGDGRTASVELAARTHVIVTAELAVDEAVATVAGLDRAELSRFTVPLHDVAAADVVGELATAIDRALASAARGHRPVVDLAVVVDGGVAGRPPVAIGSTRLGIEPVDLLGELAVRSSAIRALMDSTSLVSAAHAAAAAESAVGGDPDLLVIGGDGGIHAAALEGGRPRVGAHGFATWFAHLPVVPNGSKCACGQRGCLATVADAAGVLEHAGLGELDRTAGRTAALTELVRRIHDADDRARWAWLDAAHWIGRALQFAVTVLDPGEIVVRGYWGELLEDIETSYRDNRPTIAGEALVGMPGFVSAEAGHDAAIAGARIIARERLLADPLRLAV
ncbi:ROK family protein [Agromyces sp. MMS24-JH15]|uniref:ROK family protein n=1 Tax=Agromyces sp. MMS24-JH15 TaxID=3243765 RepID=UPI00374A5A67